MKREIRPLRDVVDHRGAGSDRGRLIVWLLLSCGHSVVRHDRMIAYPRHGEPDGTRARCEHCAKGCPASVSHEC